jgi:O-acetyl-ADP-ribose deacetylase (regulator of RNase III)
MQRLGFKLIVSAVNEELHAEFVKAFDGFPEVEVVFSRFEDTDFDCVVSAANGFGLMDGGVDQCITDMFGVQMMHRVQQKIINQYAGEQPVGTSMIVRGNEHTLAYGNKYVAHTPTMRVPRDVSCSDNAYKAMKAALLAVQAHNREVDSRTINGQTNKMEIQTNDPVNPIKEIYLDTRINSVVTPGLATLTGRIPYDKAAKQMALATYHVMNPPKAINWYYASERDAEIQESRHYEKVD